MGRAYDGGYAEYTLVPASQVIPLQTTQPWERLAAIPETYLTAWGSLFDAMEVQTGQSLLVRGGTSSVGMAAIALAYEVMHMIRKGQVRGVGKGDVSEQVAFIARLFGMAA